MKKACIGCMLGMLSIASSAEVVTVFDFSSGPESGIEMPKDFTWPESGSVSLGDDATFSMGDVDISVSKRNTTSKPKINKVQDEDRWSLRTYKGNKILIVCQDYNLIKFRIYLYTDIPSDLSELPQMPGNQTVTYDEENNWLDWNGCQQSLYLDPMGKLFMNKIEVTTDKVTSSSDDTFSDYNESSVRYLNLQGHPVANPSGGIFIRISSGRTEKIYIP